MDNNIENQIANKEASEERYLFCNGCGMPESWVEDKWGYLICSHCGYPKTI